MGIARLGLTPPPPRGNGQRGPFFGRQKRHLSAYYRIKFQLIMMVKIMNMMMKIVIIMMPVMMTMTKNLQLL